MEKKLKVNSKKSKIVEKANGKKQDE